MIIAILIAVTGLALAQGDERTPYEGPPSYDPTYPSPGVFRYGSKNDRTDEQQGETAYHPPNVFIVKNHKDGGINQEEPVGLTSQNQKPTDDLEAPYRGPQFPDPKPEPPGYYEPRQRNSRFESITPDGFKSTIEEVGTKWLPPFQEGAPHNDKAFAAYDQDIMKQIMALGDPLAGGYTEQKDLKLESLPTRRTGRPRELILEAPPRNIDQFEPERQLPKIPEEFSEIDPLPEDQKYDMPMEDSRKITNGQGHSEQDPYQEEPMRNSPKVLEGQEETSKFRPETRETAFKSRNRDNDFSKSDAINHPESYPPIEASESDTTFSETKSIPTPAEDNRSDMYDQPRHIAPSFRQSYLDDREAEPRYPLIRSETQFRRYANQRRHSSDVDQHEFIPRSYHGGHRESYRLSPRSHPGRYQGHEHPRSYYPRRRYHSNDYDEAYAASNPYQRGSSRRFQEISRQRAGLRNEPEEPVIDFPEPYIPKDAARFLAKWSHISPERNEKKNNPRRKYERYEYRQPRRPRYEVDNEEPPEIKSETRQRPEVTIERIPDSSKNVERKQGGFEEECETCPCEDCSQCCCNCDQGEEDESPSPDDEVNAANEEQQEDRPSRRGKDAEKEDEGKTESKKATTEKSGYYTITSQEA